MAAMMSTAGATQDLQRACDGTEHEAVPHNLPLLVQVPLLHSSAIWSCITFFIIVIFIRTALRLVV